MKVNLKRKFFVYLVSKELMVFAQRLMISKVIFLQKILVQIFSALQQQHVLMENVFPSVMAMFTMSEINVKIKLKMI